MHRIIGYAPEFKFYDLHFFRKILKFCVNKMLRYDEIFSNEGETVYSNQNSGFAGHTTYELKMRMGKEA